MGDTILGATIAKALAIGWLAAGGGLYAASQQENPGAAPTPCAGNAHRAFDFWLGEWNVTASGASQFTATSRIGSRHGGCVILEQYDAGAYAGMSLSFYDRVSGRWHQTWMANDGAPVYLEGNLDGEGAMILSDAELPISRATGTINRVTWTPEDGGAVRQFWEISTDSGENWSVAFDGLYTPRENVGAE
ncbi:hypothetical protein [Parasphingopyxis lamellibrachiae]|uniref:DUF1579 domain-containing protein n=1 Tax=Parasphingopyxis lamellibrachiae TaxID=680125 RepID=A0A3D9FGY9_9SPHN|nr:hypothetical protein [Parasphingopyxis lamellibrachiae]RED17059.1 hypothetical protein DFR46_2093 [Parasphingopyxis lamellibrachiae]